LPQDLRELLLSQSLREECETQYKQLAGDRGKIGNAEIVPIVLHLAALNPQKASSIGDDQIENFVKLFDANEDGSICFDEFTSLVQFVMISAHLETPEGQALLESAKIEDSRFKELLEIMETDRERINDIVPFLPDWLVMHLTSDAFLVDCNLRFDELDADRSGVLEPAELLPVVLALAKCDAGTVDQTKLTRFVKIFDVAGNDVITRDEFIDFTQFMAVMHFLESTVEGQQVQQASLDYADITEVRKNINMLKDDWTSLPQVYSFLPSSLLKDIASNEFAKQCSDSFAAADVGKRGAVELPTLVPLLVKLCAEHPLKMDEKRCKEFFKCFDKQRTGVIRNDQVVDLCRYVVVLAYLTACFEWHDATIKRSRDQIQDLLAYLKQKAAMIDDILPFLPPELNEDLMSYDFERHCMEDFKELDKANSGVLEPKELIPVILHLSKGHHLALEFDHVMEFVQIFDTKKNGVLTPSEFVNFCRFMIVIGYLESEEGRAVVEAVDVSAGARQVNELLETLEKDRNAIHKVVPLLPAEVYDDVTSDSFMKDCQDRFAALDKDKSGTLEPEELYPVIVELSQAHPYAIDIEHCKKFTKIFDIVGNGVIMKDEFVDFVRFLVIMNYMQSDDGRKKMEDGLTIMESSQNIDELIEVLKKDRHEMRKVIPYLPEDLRQELLGQEFAENCMTKFKALDKDSNGSLDPMELFPIIQDMTSAHEYALDIDQCTRFTAIFDDEKTGVISQKEFVNFARFLMVMSFLGTEDGKKALAIANADEREAEEARKDAERAKEKKQLQRQDPSTALVPYSATGNTSMSGDADTKHMVVDLEFYKSKSDKLSSENETLRNKLFRMDDVIRRLESRLEDQEMRLRHAELDLGAAGKPMR
jgi:Ca2+-binding EF-hand superfamily protein